MCVGSESLSMLTEPSEEMHKLSKIFKVVLIERYQKAHCIIYAHSLCRMILKDLGAIAQHTYRALVESRLKNCHCVVAKGAPVQN